MHSVYPADIRGRGGESERERGAGSLSRQRHEISRSHGRTTERTTQPGNTFKSLALIHMHFCAFYGMLRVNINCKMSYLHMQNQI